MNVGNRYAQTQQETASNERLLVMLFERALRDMNDASRSFRDGRIGAAVQEATHASDIVVELHSVLDHKRAPELCAQLEDVYRFVLLRLAEAMASHDPVKTDEAARVLAPLVDAFNTAVATANMSSW